MQKGRYLSDLEEDTGEEGWPGPSRTGYWWTWFIRDLVSTMSQFHPSILTSLTRGSTSWLSQEPAKTSLRSLNMWPLDFQGDIWEHSLSKSHTRHDLSKQPEKEYNKQQGHYGFHTKWKQECATDRLCRFFSSDIINIRTLRATASMKNSILVEMGNTLINKHAFKAIEWWFNKFRFC